MLQMPTEVDPSHMGASKWALIADASSIWQPTVHITNSWTKTSSILATTKPVVWSVATITTSRTVNISLIWRWSRGWFCKAWKRDILLIIPTHMSFHWSRSITRASRNQIHRMSLITTVALSNSSYWWSNAWWPWKCFCQFKGRGRSIEAVMTTWSCRTIRRCPCWWSNRDRRCRSSPTISLVSTTQSWFLPVSATAVTILVIIGAVYLISIFIVLLFRVSVTLPLFIPKVIAGSKPVMLTSLLLPQPRSLPFHEPLTVVFIWLAAHLFFFSPAIGAIRTPTFLLLYLSIATTRNLSTEKSIKHKGYS